jgi:hypothetical protein
MTRATAASTHKRLAISFACVALSVLALPALAAASEQPTGESNSRGGKSEITITARDKSSDAASTSEAAKTKPPKPARANSGDDKTKGLERASNVVKREDIQMKLTELRRLIALLQDRLNGMKGIGSEVRDLNKNPGAHSPKPEANPYLAVAVVSMSDTLLPGSDATTTDDAGTFTFTLALTASGTAVSIPLTAGTVSASTTGILYGIERGASSTLAVNASSSAVVTTNGSTTAGALVLAAGETKNVTVAVTVDPTVTDSYRVVLKSLYTSKGVRTLTPVDTFTSDTLTITH